MKRTVSLIAYVSLATLLSASEGTSGLPIVFTDVARQAGLDFTQTIGDSEMSNIVEATGVGCGFLDYDGDEWMDIYLVNGCWLKELSDPNIAPGKRKELTEATDRLYRNLGDGSFRDVTLQAGLARPAYGMAVVSADYDGDGDTDIYVTNYGPNLLYRNNGDGTFTEVAKQARVDVREFSVGAVFFDYDGDGHLDLYVGNYLTYEPDLSRQHTPEGVRSPLAYQGQQDRLFRNRGDGTFADVTRAAGIEVQPIGRAMGVGTLDYDGDSHLDVFVSNDAMENFLLRNKGDGTFQNEALFAGAAFGEAGDAAAAMAVEAGDFDGDGLFDILVPDMNRCCLYHNLGGGMFEDIATRAGISAAMTHSHGWAGVLADFDLDGDLDVYISSGSACSFQAQHDALFVNQGGGQLQQVTATSGSPAANLVEKFVSRGVAAADYDNDGDVDLLVNNLNARPVLLRNDTPRAGSHWLQVELVGRGSNRDAIGTQIRAEIGGRVLLRQRASAGSYLSQHDSRIHFGLGKHAKVDRLQIVWPDRSQQSFKDVPADQRVVVRQEANGNGKDQ
ncbi:MAG: CRTAC1 family protein [Phycisphaerales bacterium]|nr:MAG: CRTAC1 family protein [Phycisphaerales bacterium]